MRVDLSKIKSAVNYNASDDSGVRSLHAHSSTELIGEPFQKLKLFIGEISRTKDIHFVTWGKWSMPDLLFYILKQTGPAHLLISTWSIANDAMEKLILRYRKKEVLSCSFLLDPRVRARDPKPLQLAERNFTCRLVACHAKVTVLWNQEWKLTIYGSANFTYNPRIERGIISPNKNVFNFDKNWINDAINRGPDNRH